jgi:hypothetical protein
MQTHIGHKQLQQIYGLTPFAWPIWCWNNTPNMQDTEKCTAQQMFDATTTNINPKHWKPFGCPVYVLNNALQQGTIHHKWKQRSRVGIYLGPSPQHSRNVALVLDQNTGLVSPQFHVELDPSFHMVKEDNKNDSLWQLKAGFVSQREHIDSIAPKEATRQNNKRKRAEQKGPKKGASPNKRAKR